MVGAGVLIVGGAAALQADTRMHANDRRARRNATHLGYIVMIHDSVTGLRNQTQSNTANIQAERPDEGTHSRKAQPAQELSTHTKQTHLCRATRTAEGMKTRAARSMRAACTAMSLRVSLGIVSVEREWPVAMLSTKPLAEACIMGLSELCELPGCMGGPTAQLYCTSAGAGARDGPVAMASCASCQVQHVWKELAGAGRSPSVHHSVHHSRMRRTGPCRFRLSPWQATWQAPSLGPSDLLAPTSP